MTQAKTSGNIFNELNRLIFDIDTSKLKDKVKRINVLGEFDKKLWLPADKAVLIEDVEKMIESTYNLYVIPENQSVPKVLIQGINHPISAMRAELLEKLNFLKGK